MVEPDSWIRTGGDELIIDDQCGSFVSGAKIGQSRENAISLSQKAVRHPAPHVEAAPISSGRATGSLAESALFKMRAVLDTIELS